MTLFRVEQSEYDYSPTLGIFDSLERAEEFLATLGATKKTDQWCTYWATPNDRETYNIYSLELNILGETRVV